MVYACSIGQDLSLAKFRKQLSNVQTDLDKLIYTMKTIHKTTKATQFPQFWNEEWLEVAIKELDTRAMTPEMRMAYEMTLANNALAIDNEKKRVEQAEKAMEKAVKKAVKKETVKNALLMGLTSEQSAQLAGVSLEFVEEVKRGLSSKN